MSASPQELLATLLATGGDFAEVYRETTRRTSLALDDGDIDAAAVVRDSGTALRLVQGERTFFANANTDDPRRLQDMARDLAATLDGSPRQAPDVFHQVPAVALAAAEQPPSQVAIADKVAILHRADAAARGADSRVSQVTARYMDVVQDVEIHNSDGEQAQDTRVITTLAVQVLARQDEELRTGYEADSHTQGFEMFTTLPPEVTAGRATRQALLQLEAAPAPAGTFMVVLSSRAGGTMVHEACGHGLEGDFADKGLSVYTGRQGEQVASPLITVVDDGTLPGRRGTCRYDDEGTPTSRVVLIENGILKGFLHSRRSARHLGESPTGNGRRESFRHLPIPRMRNTMIAPGSEDPDAILASVKDGIFVAHMGGGEVDIASGQFVFHCAEAYRIRDGKLAEPLRDATLAGNGPEILRTIDRVGSDLGFQVGTCGKDGQGVPVADAQPTLRIPAIVVGGATATS
jgi:TldD protein